MQEFYFIINQVKSDGETKIIYDGDYYSPSHLFTQLQKLTGENPFVNRNVYHILMSEITIPDKGIGSPHFRLEQCGLEKKPVEWKFSPGWGIWHDNEREPVKKAVEIFSKRVLELLV